MESDSDEEVFQLKEPDKTTCSKIGSDDEDKIIGCLIAIACGDILGANAEFLTVESIAKKFEGGKVHSFVGSAWRPLGMFTDDTEMATALAGLGYGPSVTKILKALLFEDADFSKTATMTYPEGSFANGGVMRIAPLGIVYRNANLDVLHEAVSLALLSTHIHPEAIDGAYLQAWVVGQLIKMNDVDFPVNEFAHKVLSNAHTDILKQKISIVIELLDKNIEQLDAFKKITDTEDSNFFQIRASDAFACSLYMFLKYGINNPSESLIDTVSLGGDADTVGAILGALLGALHGCSFIPKRWFDNIENGNYGKNFIIETARKLSKLQRISIDHGIFDTTHFSIHKKLNILKNEFIESNISKTKFNELFDKFKDPVTLVMYKDVAVSVLSILKIHCEMDLPNSIHRDLWNQLRTVKSEI